MKKPHLSDFNLTEHLLKVERQKRFQLKFVIIFLAVLAGFTDYLFWVWTFSTIGNWSLLGLILSFYGLVPGVFSYIFLDKYFGEHFYCGLKNYEAAKNAYDQWFAKNSIIFWDSLTGRQFEYAVANLLNNAGYSAKVTPASGDKGVDVFLSDGTIIQCKAHQSCVYPSVVRELYGTLQDFKAPQAILVSKNGFSKGVYEFSHDKNILLWDVNSLIAIQKGIED